MARSAAGRVNRAGVTYDPRTGMKVRGNKLRPDGENPNLYTTDPDELNPQRFVRPFTGKDGNRNWRVGNPSQDAIGASVNPLVTFGHNSLLPMPFPQLSIGNPAPVVAYTIGDSVWPATGPEALTIERGGGEWDATSTGEYGAGEFGAGTFGEGLGGTQSGTF